VLAKDFGGDQASWSRTYNTNFPRLDVGHFRRGWLMGSWWSGTVARKTAKDRLLE